MSVEDNDDNAGTATRPNPGSDKAIALGCRCAVLDNHHGRYPCMGYDDETGEALWSTTENCPLHGRQPSRSS